MRSKLLRELVHQLLKGLDALGGILARLRSILCGLQTLGLARDPWMVLRRERGLAGLDSTTRARRLERHQARDCSTSHTLLRVAQQRT